MNFQLNLLNQDSKVTGQGVNSVHSIIEKISKLKIPDIGSFLVNSLISHIDYNEYLKTTITKTLKDVSGMISRPYPNVTLKTKTNRTKRVLSVSLLYNYL